MNGVLLMDKARGPSSFEVVAGVRRALQVRRVGHAGTLDPMATGLLAVCIGEATKLVPFLMAGEKVYQAEALLGVATDTFDADGRVVAERDAAGVGRAAIEAALDTLRGTIWQEPPMHSAVRIQGRRLYQLARQGLEVEREPRQVEVKAIELGEVEPEGARVRIRFCVRCGKGTYVRALAHDLGERLGVGAHLTGLRRTAIGRLRVEDAVQLGGLSPATPLLGMAEALGDLPALRLDAATADEVRQGKLSAMARLAPPPSAHPPSDSHAVSPAYVRLLRPDGTLLAVASAQTGRLALERVFAGAPTGQPVAPPVPTEVDKRGRFGPNTLSKNEKMGKAKT